MTSLRVVMPLRLLTNYGRFGGIYRMSLYKSSASSGVCERKFSKQTRVSNRNRNWIAAKPKQLLSLLERTDLEFLRCS